MNTSQPSYTCTFFLKVTSSNEAVLSKNSVEISNKAENILKVEFQSSKIGFANLTVTITDNTNSTASVVVPINVLSLPKWSLHRPSTVYLTDKGSSEKIFIPVTGGSGFLQKGYAIKERDPITVLYYVYCCYKLYALHFLI